MIDYLSGVDCCTNKENLEPLIEGWWRESNLLPGYYHLRCKKCMAGNFYNITLFQDVSDIGVEQEEEVKA